MANLQRWEGQHLDICIRGIQLSMSNDPKLLTLTLLALVLFSEGVLTYCNPCRLVMSIYLCTWGRERANV